MSWPCLGCGKELENGAMAVRDESTLKCSAKLWCDECGLGHWMEDGILVSLNTTPHSPEPRKRWRDIPGGCLAVIWDEVDCG